MIVFVFSFCFVLLSVVSLLLLLFVCDCVCVLFRSPRHRRLFPLSYGRRLRAIGLRKAKRSEAERRHSIGQQHAHTHTNMSIAPSVTTHTYIHNTAGRVGGAHSRAASRRLVELSGAAAAIRPNDDETKRQMTTMTDHTACTHTYVTTIHSMYRCVLFELVDCFHRRRVSPWLDSNAALSRVASPHFDPPQRPKGKKTTTLTTHTLVHV